MTVLILMAVIFCAFFFFPLAGFTVRAVKSFGSTSGAAAGPIAPGLLSTLKFTAMQAFLSALLSILAALPGAYALSHFNFPLRRFIKSLSLVPFVLPSIIVIICMISFYGRAGVLNSLLGADLKLIYSFAGIIVAHLFYNYALALRIIGDGWGRIGDGYANIAQSLGDSRRWTFLRVTLRLLLPSILSAFALIFIYCFMSFGIVLVFGGIRYATLEVRIYQEFYQKLNFERGAVYALVQIGLSALFLIGAGRIGRVFGGSEREAEVRALKPLKEEPAQTRIAVSVYWIATCLFILGPIAAMIGKSMFADGSFSLQSYASLFAHDAPRNVEGLIRSTIGAVILRSVGMALGSGALTFVCALASSTALRNRNGVAWRILFQLPMGMTAVGLAMSLRFVLGGRIATVALVLAGQFFIAFPMVFRVTDTVVADLKESLIDCAMSLGAKPARVFFSVHLPVMRRGLLNAYAFAVALAFADFTVVLGVGRGEIVTFPIAVFRLLGFKSFDLALALSGLYIGFCFLLFLLIDRTSGEKSALARKPTGLAKEGI
jgi:thiamine transport system permease protein